MNYSASDDISNAINHQKTEEMGKRGCYPTFTIIVHLLISQHPRGGKGRRPDRDKASYIPRAMTRGVDRERSILGIKLEGPK